MYLVYIKCEGGVFT